MTYDTCVTQGYTCVTQVACFSTTNHQSEPVSMAIVTWPQTH